MFVFALKPPGQNGTWHRRPRCGKLASVALTVAALLTAADSPAAQLIWDAGDTNNGATIDAASGSWNTDTANLNWNDGAGNVSWTQTSVTAALNGATFAGPDTAAGTYQIALDGSQIAFNNLTINANGYVFSGANLYQTPANAVLSVADGVGVTFNNNISGPNSALVWRLGAGGSPASMTLLGNFTGGQFAVGSTNGSTLWLGGGGTSAGGVFTINANTIHTNGTWNNTATWQVGRPGAGGTYADAGKAVFPGVYTMDGDSAILNLSAQMMISRSAGSGKVIIKKGTVNLTAASANATVEVLKDAGAEGRGFFSMEGGTMTVGSSANAGVIGLAKFGAGANSQAVFSQSGGTIRAWGGIISGGSGTFNSSSISAFTNSGGFLYIGNVGGVGISLGGATPATNYFVFSGGTVGALQSWSSTVPLTLDTLNGNITFQCADEWFTPYNITLSGALTGPGGLYKTGGGTLTLGGANDYAGSTVVSNGILKIVPVLSPTHGPLTLDGSAGWPYASLSIAPVSAGQFMTVNGNLTYAVGMVTSDFDFGGLPPSTSVAPIQVANNVVCTVTPDFTIAGSAIAVGTYPLIQYGGSVSGTLPATPTVLPASTSGYITNIVATKTIALVVTSSPVSAALTWRIGSGDWGLIAAQNWSLFGSPINYTEPNGVEFDDTASGPFPITVSTVTAVSPTAITILSTNDWTISSNGGSIDGPASLTKAGSGTATLSGANTYSGGTTISGGQLNINNGGDSAANSAIGTGPLTLALGAKVDNASGQPVTLQPSIAQHWQDDWTYVGSANLNTGDGAVALGSSVVVLTVANNTLEVGGAISDNWNAYKLTKAGSGTLTLGTDNYFSGGMQLDSGLLQLKTAYGLGSGSFIISGSGAIDNLSGADLDVMGITGVTLPTTGTITYLGTSNSLSFGTVAAIQSGQGNKILNVVNNTLTFGGDFTTGNSLITKTGQGRLVLSGSGTSQFVGNVNEGELVLAHDFNSAIGTGGGSGGYGLLVQSNAVATLAGTLENQIPNGVGGASYIQTRLNAGGILDMNGKNETLDMLSMTNGVLRNSLAGYWSTLTIAPTGGAHDTNAVILSDANNVLDVPSNDAGLYVAGNVTGTGSLVKSGLGVVDLQGDNSYTGNTTVSNGTLILRFPFLAATSTVSVHTNALLGNNGVLNLNFPGSETNTVAALVLGGVSKPEGVYSATTDPGYLAGTGSLHVAVVVATNPTNIQFSVSGNILSLSWPSDHLGWTLQTNAVSVVTPASWFPYPGSPLVTNVDISINPAATNVFFRLVYP